MEADSDGIAFAEFESDVPRAICIDRAAFWVATLKSLKIDARKIQVFQRVRIVENVNRRPMRYEVSRRLWEFCDTRSPVNHARTNRRHLFEICRN